MSKSNSKKEIFSLRQEFHQALEKSGFIEEISLSQDAYIEILETNKSDLKKVVINHLKLSSKNDKNISTEVDKIWVINLEKELPGISASGKTPEKAILVLQRKVNDAGKILNYHLQICLVELKASLQAKKGKESTLKQLAGKFQSGMNRIYMLLTLNNYANPQKNYQDTEIFVHFRGIIFYNRNEIKDSDIAKENQRDYNSSESTLYKILSQSTESDLLTLETLLEERDKIVVRFIKNPNQNQNYVTIGLKELL
jgi:succinate dehydrogenase flavin-adding protein (antitoxin of CptAB toxin-antitoxin module)